MTEIWEATRVQLRVNNALFHRAHWATAAAEGHLRVDVAAVDVKCEERGNSHHLTGAAGSHRHERNHDHQDGPCEADPMHGCQGCPAVISHNCCRCGQQTRMFLQ